jgi:hypothetical protein
MQEALLKEKEAKNRIQDAFDDARSQWQAREEELKRQLSLYEQGVRREIERETLKSTKVVKKQRQRLRDALWSKKAYSRKEAQHRDPPTKVRHLDALAQPEADSPRARVRHRHAGGMAYQAGRSCQELEASTLPSSPHAHARTQC